MHASTFDYLKPTDQQIENMAIMRQASKAYCQAIEAMVPDGPDRTYLVRKHREVAMWINVAITRQPDGAPRQ